MKKEILDCIKKGGVSFVELAREVPGFKGDYQIRNEHNWVFWAGLSVDAANTLHELEMDGLIEKHPCDAIIYVMDGGWLQLPLVKTARTYKKPHWMPVTYSLAK